MENKEQKTCASNTLPIKRRQVEEGVTILHETGCTELNITINKGEENKIIETFIRPAKEGGCRASLEAVGRLISLALRYGIPLQEVIKQLRGIRCKACTAKSFDNELPDLHYSCPDSISRALGKADRFFKGEKKNVEDI